MVSEIVIPKNISPTVQSFFAKTYSNVNIKCVKTSRGIVCDDAKFRLLFSNDGSISLIDMVHAIIVLRYTGDGVYYNGTKLDDDGTIYLSVKHGDDVALIPLFVKDIKLAFEKYKERVQKAVT